MLVLKVIQSPEDSGAPIGTAFRVPEGGRRILGRSKLAHVRVQAKNISRKHAEFIPVDDWWYVKDLGSKNGTIVNGKKIAKPVLLRTSDTVVLADHTFQAEMVAGLATNSPDATPGAVIMVTPEGFEAELPIPGDAGTDPQVVQARKPIEKVDPNEGLQLDDADPLSISGNDLLQDADLIISDDLVDMPAEAPASPPAATPSSADNNLLLESLELTGLDDIDEALPIQQQEAAISSQEPDDPSGETLLPDTDLNQPAEGSGAFEILDLDDIEDAEDLEIAEVENAHIQEVAQATGQPLAGPDAETHIPGMDKKTPQQANHDSEALPMQPTAGPNDQTVITPRDELNQTVLAQSQLNSMDEEEDDDATLPGIPGRKPQKPKEDLDKWLDDLTNDMTFPGGRAKKNEGSGPAQPASSPPEQPVFPAEATQDIQLPPNPMGEDTDKLGNMQFSHQEPAAAPGPSSDPFGQVDNLDYKGETYFDEDDDNEETMVWEDTLELEELSGQTQTSAEAESSAVLLEAPPAEFQDPALTDVDTENDLPEFTGAADVEIYEAEVARGIHFDDWQLPKYTVIKDVPPAFKPPKAIRLRKVIAGRPPMAYFQEANPLQEAIADKVISGTPSLPVSAPLESEAQSPLSQPLAAPAQTIITEQLPEADTRRVESRLDSKPQTGLTDPLPTFKNRAMRIRIKARAKPKAAPTLIDAQPVAIGDPEVSTHPVAISDAIKAQTPTAITHTDATLDTHTPAIEYCLTSIPQQSVQDKAALKTSAASLDHLKPLAIKLPVEKAESKKKIKRIGCRLKVRKHKPLRLSVPNLPVLPARAIIPENEIKPQAAHFETATTQHTCMHHAEAAPKVAAAKSILEEALAHTAATHNIQPDSPQAIASAMTTVDSEVARSIIKYATPAAVTEAIQEELLPAIMHGIAAPRHKRLKDSEDWRSLFESLAELSGFLTDEPSIEDPLDDEADDFDDGEELINQKAIVTEDDELKLAATSSAMEDIESSATESTLLLDLVKTPSVTPHWIEEANRRRRNNPWLKVGIAVSSAILLTLITYLILNNL